MEAVWRLRSLVDAELCCHLVFLTVKWFFKKMSVVIDSTAAIVIHSYFQLIDWLIARWMDGLTNDWLIWLICCNVGSMVHRKATWSCFLFQWFQSSWRPCCMRNYAEHSLWEAKFAMPAVTCAGPLLVLMSRRICHNLWRILQSIFDFFFSFLQNYDLGQCTAIFKYQNSEKSSTEMWNLK